MSVYVARAAENFRGQASRAGALSVFLQTNPFNLQELQYHPSTTVRLASPSADTQVLIRAALTGLKRIHKPGCRYRKAGVMLLDLSAETVEQGPIGGSVLLADRGRLMAAFDQLNQRMGRGTLWIAAEGMNQSWRMHRGNLSPAYTSRWDQLPVVRPDAIFLFSPPFALQRDRQH
ncbi:DUF4113 domain-containing protein [Methylocaldum sp.]|uniref:DUF4113 domain-containing protein n=1 Tax=Methylocaldum sp. TaxID=1969727 RepID=UPI002D596378|nr:DUF4113 domain-containing protein [Methylocaldum sp.]HYE33992.1 DUF4113 domain-containing protein [Methylocaldum sp.]